MKEATWDGFRAKSSDTKERRRIAAGRRQRAAPDLVAAMADVSGCRAGYQLPGERGAGNGSGSAGQSGQSS